MQEPSVFRGSDRSWVDQYAAIGEFVVAFEGSCFWLRNSSLALLQMKGLTDGSLADVIFNQRVFSAEPLFECFASLVAEAVPKEAEVLKKISSIRGRFKDLCKLRNDLLHGQYLIGPDVDVVTTNEAPPSFHVERRTPDKSGARVTLVATSLDEMRVHIALAWKIKAELIEVFSSMMQCLYAPLKTQPEA